MTFDEYTKRMAEIQQRTPDPGMTSAAELAVFFQKKAYDQQVLLDEYAPQPSRWDALKRLVRPW